ncbi:1,2-phenylacetyl-CoA epoxidase subunit PaaD [Prauserella marina]|uniref:1,2-phenylacetyl-CoA epoxidase subunit PaaD n=1 Tax=Prauserella marina TaxID=530584 RepID=UPI001B876630|nr:1,2-phenylacetyl-CoA epoxidase subunit PaaD [Prauserella marina]
MVSARAVAERVTDPELPMLTLAELGILREVFEEDGKVIVSITPTYLGCPAMDTMRDDLLHALGEAGYPDVEVRTVLAPAWSTDWITERGKAKLADAGIAPPGKAPFTAKGPVPLTLTVRDDVTCPRCGHADTTELSRFGASACRALRRCPACGEPFEHMKEI